MRASAAPVLASPASAPHPVRIRHLLVLAALGSLVWSAVPRLRAAFELHSAATAFADYALCMVGPTGPQLLRDNPADFRKLVRRRLVAAGADDHPFVRCAKAAGQVTRSASVERAHRAAAQSFVEYGGAAADGAYDAVRLDDLAVTTRLLSETADAAWPFVRGGYTALVLPSAYAAEAPHPVELPRPGAARGAVPPRSLARCEVAGSGVAYVIGLSPDRRSQIVRSVTPGGVTSDASLAPADARVFTASCDEHALALAMGRPGTRQVELYRCAYLGECAPMPMPRFGASGPAPNYPLDVARVDGVTVVAVPMHGIVRIASTRDDGRTWTPFTVAYDSAAYPDMHFDVVPDRLQAVGHKVVLYGAPPRTGGMFPVLVSHDQGASFRGQ